MTDLHSDELIGRYPLKAIGITAAAILFVLVSVWGLGYAMGQREQAIATTEAENRANVAKGEADAAKAQAQAKDAEIAAKDYGLAEARADVARKVAQLAAYRATLPAQPAANPPHDEPIQPGVVDLAPLVARQDEVIKAQLIYITGLEFKVSDVTASRDLWKASSEAREREAAGLRIALEAQKSLTKGALWKGRIQGLAVGLGTGYVIGKTR